MPRTLTHYELDYRPTPAEHERYTAPYTNLTTYMPHERDLAYRMQRELTEYGNGKVEVRLVECYTTYEGDAR